jgi:glutathione S-transferase
MTSDTFKPTAYIKDGCPFSFKFLVFMAETGLLRDIDIVQLHEGQPALESTKRRLGEILGKPASFPTVEIERDRYLADSDRIIEHFAERHHLRADELPVLSFYKQTILPKLFKLHELTKGAKP